MSDDPPRATRRAVLALVTGTAMAGCAGLPNPLGAGPRRLDRAGLAEVVSGAPPAVPRSVPVAVTDAHRRGHAERAEALLSRAPLPFDETELPNGAMRAEMNRTADEARSALDRADGAPTPFEALAALRDARGAGRAVATAWAYADDGLRAGDLEDDAAALGEDVAAFRERRTYVGDDPVGAAVVHRAIETLARAAAQRRTGNPRVTREDENLVTVSERAADIERGRAALDDAAHLYDALRSDASPERDLRAAFEDALDGLAATLRAETADFDPDEPASALVDADVEGSPVEYPLRYLHGDLARGAGTRDHRDRGELASGLLAAHRELSRLRAFEDLRERVEGGESYAVESVADVRARREAAVTAVEAALRESGHPDLSREVLDGAAALVRRVDGEIGRYGTAGDGVRADSLGREVGEYVYAAAVARSTPAASDAVASALSR